ncbi:hypothetical protein [Sphingomonas sp. Y38-1Y]|uniref:hypothetical protein n=1 Tax=Sphingomonas sp. Y38-1Y TaxID=3078265 RepID=UPI0028E18CB2|nr:hypothetical protein [Sphingomonas sp. Y38-1Y]
MLTALLLVAALPQTQPAPAPVTKAEPAKKICKGRANTGSRLRSKPVCKTQAEWDSDAALNADQTRGMSQMQGQR